MKYCTLSIILTILTANSLFAQRMVQGILTDKNKKGIKGVAVYCSDQRYYTVTDNKGAFKFLIPNQDSILFFELRGKVNQQEKITSLQNIYHFTLNDNPEIFSLNNNILKEVAIKEYRKPMLSVSETRTSKSVINEEKPLPSSIVYKAPLLKADCTTSVYPEKPENKKKDKKVDNPKFMSAPKPVEEIPTIDATNIEGSISYDEDKIGTDPEVTLSTATSGSVETNAKAGMLTCGEINDFSKWNLWTDKSQEELSLYKMQWHFFYKQRIMVQCVNKDWLPVPNVNVQLVDNKNDEIIYEAVTDNTGKAELWINAYENKNKRLNNLEIICKKDGISKVINNPKFFDENINTAQAAWDCKEYNAIDIAMVVDATGSMTDEINYLKSDLSNVISQIQDSMRQSTLRIASVFYRDLHDEYVTRISDFESNVDHGLEFIQNQQANDGGDFPEAVDAALYDAIYRLQWNKNAIARILFLVLDAPPHNDAPYLERLQQIIYDAAAMGIRIVPITCSGTDKSTEFAMRNFALATNGTYVFLTNDSGIGGSHISPTTDTFTVNKLNQVLVNIVLGMSYYPSCESQPEVKLNQDTSEVNFVLESSNNQDNDTIVDANPAWWQYYPNPSIGLVTIESSENIKTLYLCDISGKAIQVINFDDSKKVQLDLSQYASGMYLLRYEIKPNEWVYGRLILSR